MQPPENGGHSLNKRLNSRRLYTPVGVAKVKAKAVLGLILGLEKARGDTAPLILMGDMGMDRAGKALLWAQGRNRAGKGHNTAATTTLVMKPMDNPGADPVTGAAIAVTNATQTKGLDLVMVVSHLYLLRGAIRPLGQLSRK